MQKLSTLIQGIFALALISISSFYTTATQASQKGGIDWIVVVDTSASMRGVGGTKNIFNQVKKSITEFVNTAKLGDTVTIYTFDRDVKLNANDIRINGNSDRGKLKQIISSLQAEGMRTHTGKAVQKALEHSAMLNQRTDALGRTTSVLFFTDGVEEVSGIPNPVSIPSNIQLLRQQECKPYVFFVSLGLKKHENQLNDFARNPALCGKGRVLRDPGGVQLNRLAQNIRPVLVQPKLDANLSKVNVQSVLPGTTTELLKIESISNVNAKVRVKLQDPSQSGIRLIAANNIIDLPANQTINIPVQLQIPVDAEGGTTKNLSLVLASIDNAIAPISIDLPVTIKPILELQPTEIDFGSLEAGKTTVIQTLTVKSNMSGKANLQIQGNSKHLSLRKPETAISLQVGENQVPVQLQVADSGGEEKRTFTLVLTPENPLASPISAEVHVNIFMPLGRKIIIWSFLLLLLLLIVLIGICIFQRKTPWELLQDIRTRNYLAGSLIVLEPLPTSDKEEEISLTHLQKSTVRLSELIPAIATTDSDSELFVVWREGKKNIDLRCLNGGIIVNNKEVNTDELYDLDIIEIGNIKLQFNWIERPQPPELSAEQENF
jgi:hypothetical protein